MTVEPTLCPKNEDIAWQGFAARGQTRPGALADSVQGLPVFR